MRGESGCGVSKAGSENRVLPPCSYSRISSTRFFLGAGVLDGNTGLDVDVEDRGSNASRGFPVLDGLPRGSNWSAEDGLASTKSPKSSVGDRVGSNGGCDRAAGLDMIG